MHIVHTLMVRASEVVKAPAKAAKDQRSGSAASPSSIGFESRSTSRPRRKPRCGRVRCAASCSRRKTPMVARVSVDEAGSESMNPDCEMEAST